MQWGTSRFRLRARILQFIFINCLDEGIEGELVTFADYTKLGAVAKTLHQSSPTFLALRTAWGQGSRDGPT